MKKHKFHFTLLLILSSLFVLHAEIKFEVIPRTKYEAVISKLAADTVINRENIVSMGFERDSTLKIAVVRLDSSGQPLKDVYPVRPELYNEIVKGIHVKANIANKNKKESSLISAKDTAIKPVPSKQSGKKKLNQDGRIYFIAQNTIKSTYVYPVNLGIALENIPPRVTTGILFLTYGGAIYGSYRYTRNMELGYGRVAMMNYGGELGISYSALLSAFIDNIVDGTKNIDDNRIEHADNTRNKDELSEKDIDYTDDEDRFPALKFNTWTSMFAFPLGLYAGSKTNLYGNTQYGNITISRFLGRSAFLYGFMTPLLLSSDIRTKHYKKLASGLTMGLIPIGNYMGYRLTRNKDYSSGRAFLIETTGIMGAVTGFLLPRILDLNYADNNIRRFMTVTTLGCHVLGTKFGFSFHKDRSYSFGQGVFMALSATGGAALAMAVPLLADIDYERYHQAYDVPGIIGAWVGLVAGESLSRSIFEKTSHDKRQAYNISFPILYQWPVLLLSQKFSKTTESDFLKFDILKCQF